MSVPRSVAALALAAAGVVVALDVAACGGDDRRSGSGDAPAGPALTSFTLVEREFSYTPDRILGQAGVDLHFTLTNEGGVDHDFVIEEANVKVLTRPGETGTATARLPAGSYTYYCSLPGHRAGGMEGRLFVK